MRYGSKLVYHITVYFLFTLITVTCYLQIRYIDRINVSFCMLQQLLKLTATNVNASMTSEYKILPHPDKYTCCLLNNWLHRPQNPYLKLFSGASPMESVKTVIQDTPGIFVRVRQNLVRRCHVCIEVGGRQFEQLL